MISLDISILYQMVLFLVLWLILKKIFFRPYLELLEEREQKTSGARHDSEDLEQEGARLKSEYEERIARARGAGTAAKEAIVQEARKEREGLLQQARAEAARVLDSARRDVQVQLERERELAATEVAGLAQDMVGKVLGRRVVG
ncbi:MAG: ATP synthase F0 subunit B [Deltaproteobacteria bacterium]|nr:ATP synthase F0 subunit B [Deltaproteobacteria bacterium]